MKAEDNLAPSGAAVSHTVGNARCGDIIDAASKGRNAE